MAENAFSPDDVALLELVARGWTTRRISEHSSRSPRQVSNQLRDIRCRLDATTNIHAVAIAIRQGLL